MNISVTHHQLQLRKLPCAVSQMTPVTLHHCHGGSMKDAGWHVGMSMKQNPFLQIPLHSKYHVGDCGIDSGVGVETWETRYGKQTDLLAWVDEELAYPLSIWALADAWETQHRGKDGTRLRLVGGAG